MKDFGICFLPWPKIFQPLARSRRRQKSKNQKDKCVRLSKDNQAQDERVSFPIFDEMDG